MGARSVSVLIGAAYVRDLRSSSMRSTGCAIPRILYPLSTNKTCPVVALATVLTGWESDVTRRILAMEYYAAAPKAA